MNDKSKLEKLAEDYLKALPEEEIVEGDGEIVSVKAPAPGKKYAETYTCEACGRKKTIRFTSVPTPASCGFCVRCKKGLMYSEFVTEGLKNNSFTDEQKKHFRVSGVKIMMGALIEKNKKQFKRRK